MSDDHGKEGKDCFDGATQSSSANIASECRCITCEYDLRTLPTDGLCPECGTPVRDTLEAIERGGFSSAAEARRAKRLLTWLSFTLGAIFLLMLIQPFEETFRQSSSSTLAQTPLEWALQVSGDKFVTCLFLLLCCVLLMRLPRLRGSQYSRITALRISIRSAWITSIVFAGIATAGVVTEFVWLSTGFNSTVRSPMIQVLRLLELIGRTAIHLWALAFVTLATLHFCGTVAARSNRPETARAYRRVGAILGSLLILCATPSVIAETMAFLGWGTTLLKVTYPYSSGIIASLSTLSVGTTALMLAIFARGILSSSGSNATETCSCPTTLAKHAHDLAGLISWGTLFLALFAGTLATGPLLAAINSQYLFAVSAFLGMSLLILCVAAEVLVIIRLSKILATHPGLGLAWRQIRNARLALWLALVALFVVALVGPSYGSVVLFVGAIPVVYLKLSHSLLLRLRATLAGQQPATPRWFEPLLATMIGALVLLYFLLMQTGRNLNSAGAARIVLGVKDGVGSLAYTAAIWAFASLSWTSFRLRRNAAALVGPPSVLRSTLGEQPDIRETSTDTASSIRLFTKSDN